MHWDLKDEFEMQTKQLESKMEKAQFEKATLQDFVEMYRVRGSISSF